MTGAKTLQLIQKKFCIHGEMPERKKTVKSLLAPVCREWKAKTEEEGTDMVWNSAGLELKRPDPAES